MKLLFFLLIFLFVGCNSALFGRKASHIHCSCCTFNKDQNSWLNSQGKKTNCTIVDNKKIYPYMPYNNGCDFWREQFQSDSTIKFSEVPITVGSNTTKYCIKSNYISTDDSDQAILIDNGLFCLTEYTDADTFSFTSCDDLYKKNPDSKSDNNKK